MRRIKVKHHKYLMDKLRISVDEEIEEGIFLRYLFTSNEGAVYSISTEKETFSFLDHKKKLLVLEYKTNNEIIGAFEWTTEDKLLVTYNQKGQHDITKMFNAWMDEFNE